MKAVSSRETNRLHDLRLLQDHMYKRYYFGFSDLMGVSFRQDNVQGFDTKRDFYS